MANQKIDDAANGVILDVFGIGNVEVEDAHEQVSAVVQGHIEDDSSTVRDKLFKNFELENKRPVKKKTAATQLQAWALSVASSLDDDEINQGIERSTPFIHPVQTDKVWRIRTRSGRVFARINLNHPFWKDGNEDDIRHNLEEYGRTGETPPGLTLRNGLRFDAAMIGEIFASQECIADPAPDPAVFRARIQLDVRLPDAGDNLNLTVDFPRLRALVPQLSRSDIAHAVEYLSSHWDTLSKQGAIRCMQGNTEISLTGRRGTHDTFSRIARRLYRYAGLRNHDDRALFSRDYSFSDAVAIRSQAAELAKAKDKRIAFAAIKIFEHHPETMRALTMQGNAADLRRQIREATALKKAAEAVAKLSSAEKPTRAGNVVLSAASGIEKLMANMDACATLSAVPPQNVMNLLQGITTEEQQGVRAYTPIPITTFTYRITQVANQATNQLQKDNLPTLDRPRNTLDQASAKITEDREKLIKIKELLKGMRGALDARGIAAGDVAGYTVLGDLLVDAAGTGDYWDLDQLGEPNGPTGEVIDPSLDLGDLEEEFKSVLKAVPGHPAGQAHTNHAGIDFKSTADYNKDLKKLRDSERKVQHREGDAGCIDVLKAWLKHGCHLDDQEASEAVNKIKNVLHLTEKAKEGLDEAVRDIDLPVDLADLPSNKEVGGAWNEGRTFPSDIQKIKNIGNDIKEGLGGPAAAGALSYSVASVIYGISPGPWGVGVGAGIGWLAAKIAGRVKGWDKERLKAQTQKATVIGGVIGGAAATIAGGWVSLVGLLAGGAFAALTPLAKRMRRSSEKNKELDSYDTLGDYIQQLGVLKDPAETAKVSDLIDTYFFIHYLQDEEKFPNADDQSKPIALPVTRELEMQKQKLQKEVARRFILKQLKSNDCNPAIRTSIETAMQGKSVEEQGESIIQVLQSEEASTAWYAHSENRYKLQAKRAYAEVWKGIKKDVEGFEENERLRKLGAGEADDTEHHA
jgi:hypothetical protein